MLYSRKPASWWEIFRLEVWRKLRRHLSALLAPVTSSRSVSYSRLDTKFPVDPGESCTDRIVPFRTGICANLRQECVLWVDWQKAHRVTHVLSGINWEMSETPLKCVPGRTGQQKIIARRANDNNSIWMANYPPRITYVGQLSIWQENAGK